VDALEIDEQIDWASNEFGQAELGDARRTARLIALARQLAKGSNLSFPQALSSAELKAAYRFFDNDEVDTDGILTAHIGQTLGRMRELPVVLAIQDTTEFNLSHLPDTTGLGYGSGGLVRGYMMHSMLAVTPDGLPLGVLGMKTWVRNDSELGKKATRKKRPIHQKESYKWIEGLQHLDTLSKLVPQTQLVSVCDREADIYDLFAASREPGVQWLVRAAWDRNVDHPENRLWDAMKSQDVLGTTILRIPGRGKIAEREAQMTIRCAALSIHPPVDRQYKHLPDVEVNVVWAIESDPPAGCEPVEWMLLTSLPTRTMEEALERLSWYARRWTIETWHRTLKSGCMIEKRQFGDVERFERATALFAVIAWRILYATLLGRLDADISCEVMLQRFEWQALYCRANSTTKLPKNPPTLGQAVLWIAKLGGYLGRKNDLPPGATVLWRGFAALHEASQMFLIFRQKE
jgi:hypothetical protein